MIWSDLKAGDVVMTSHSVDASAWLMIRSSLRLAEDDVEISMLCLYSGRQTTHSRRARGNLSSTYTVLRGSNVEQQGDDDLK